MTGQFAMIVEGGRSKKEETYSFLDARKDNEVNMREEVSNIDGLASKRLLNKRKKMYPLCGVLLSAVLIAWLIGLTMVREFQLNSLRKDVDDLKAQIVEIKQKMEDDKLIDELKGFEDQMNAAEDKKKKPSLANTNSFADIYDDDDAIDDEDDLENSGDWSFDEKHEQIDDDDEEDDLGNGDFLGEVMEAKIHDKSQYNPDDKLPPMKKLIRFLAKEKENDEKIKAAKENKSYSRSRRDIIAETRDGVPILEEPYHIARMLNFSRIGTTPKDIGQPLPTKLTSGSPRMLMDWDDQPLPPPENMMRRKSMPKKYHDPSTTTSPEPAYIRSSRVMSTNEDPSKAQRKVIRIRKPITRSGLASDYDASYLERNPGEIGITRLRRRRKNRPNTHRNLEVADDIEVVSGAPGVQGPRKYVGKQLHNKLVAAHFSGYTDNYNMNHEHYQGNGKLLHPLDTPYTAWRPAPWLPAMDLDSQFPLNNGAVAVPESGIYFVYVQIFYHDSHNRNSYKVYRSNGVEEETILQCTSMSYTVENVEKANTCYTAGAFHLNKGDTLAIKNLGGTRYSIMQPGKSFFGLIKLADLHLK